MRVKKSAVIAILAFGLVAVCVIHYRRGKTNQVQAHSDVIATQRLDELTTALRHIPSEPYLDWEVRMYKRGNDLLAHNNDPDILKRMFYLCEDKRQNVPESVEYQHQADVYGVAQGCIIDQLANIGSRGSYEGAKALVEIMVDDELSWDCDGLFTIVEAVVKCGATALPLLEKVDLEDPIRQSKVDEAKNYISTQPSGGMVEW